MPVFHQMQTRFGEISKPKFPFLVPIYCSHLEQTYPCKFPSAHLVLISLFVGGPFRLSRTENSFFYPSDFSVDIHKSLRRLLHSHYENSVWFISCRCGGVVAQAVKGGLGEGVKTLLVISIRRGRGHAAPNENNVSVIVASATSLFGGWHPVELCSALKNANQRSIQVHCKSLSCVRLYMEAISKVERYFSLFRKNDPSLVKIGYSRRGHYGKPVFWTLEWVAHVTMSKAFLGFHFNLFLRLKLRAQTVLWKSFSLLSQAVVLGV